MIQIGFFFFRELNSNGGTSGICCRESWVNAGRRGSHSLRKESSFSSICDLRISSWCCISHQWESTNGCRSADSPCTSFKSDHLSLSLSLFSLFFSYSSSLYTSFLLSMSKQTLFLFQHCIPARSKARQFRKWNAVSEAEHEAECRNPQNPDAEVRKYLYRAAKAERPARWREWQWAMSSLPQLDSTHRKQMHVCY
jgi:hypothetical protein